jgi:hypothetical protein
MQREPSSPPLLPFREKGVGMGNMSLTGGMETIVVNGTIEEG